MTKREKIHEIHVKYHDRYGYPNRFRDYRWKSSFTQRANRDLEEAISTDNYGAFRIHTTTMGIPWRRICESHSIYYLYSLKNAGKILRALLKMGKEDRTEINVWELIWNALTDPNETFENIIRGFAECPCLDQDAKAEMLRDAIFVTDFVDRVYYGSQRSAACIDAIHDLFEELFPGKNLFPERFGSWTDTRDGEVYGTVRLMNKVWLRAPLKFGMDADGLISEEDFKARSEEIVPDGWRIPTDSDLRGLCDNPVPRINEETGKFVIFGDQDDSNVTCIAKDAQWPLLARDFAYVGKDDEKGGDEWNREVGANGLDFRPTYGTGDSRESTVMTIMSKNYKGITLRMAWSLASANNSFRPFYEPECRQYPDRYDAKVYERACILLCKDVENSDED